MNTVELVKQMHDLDILTFKIPSYESLIGKAAYNDPVINSTILRIENLMFSGFLFLWAAIIVIGVFSIFFLYEKYIKKDDKYSMLLSLIIAITALAGVIVLLFMTWDIHYSTTNLIKLVTEFMAKH